MLNLTFLQRQSRSIFFVAFAILFVTLSLSEFAYAQTPSKPIGAADIPSDVPGADLFQDFSQIEPVAASTARSVSAKFQRENPSARVFTLGRNSQDYDQNSTRPALRLDKVWVGEQTILFELTGLSRSQNSASAVMRKETLQIRNSRGQIGRLVSAEGVVELKDRRGGSALMVAPDDKLHLLFEKIDDYFAMTLFHQNIDGRESIYFDAVDPRFRERYDRMHSAAITPEGMKDFLVEFANNDPDKRVLPVFSKFIGEMRRLQSFEGYQGAFQLLGDPKDYEAMKRAAKTDEHRNVIRAIEDEKQAEVRRKEEARLAEVRRQEAIRAEQERVERLRLAEERCMQTPSCRQEVEARQAACVERINGCRRQCDSLTSGGRGIMGALVSAATYRMCASQCKCDNALGSLFATMDRLESGGQLSSRSSASVREQSSTALKGSSTKTETTTPVREPLPAAKEAKLFVCTIYCVSSSGPMIRRETPASNRANAAKIMGDRADQFCQQAGHSKASITRLPESQCYEK